MKKCTPFLIALLLFQACGNSPKEKQKQVDDENWIQLFNGHDIDDWIIKISGHPLHENYKNTFRVEDGLLLTRYDAYEHFNGEYGHLFYKTPFSHYKLRVEYRVVGSQVEGGPAWAFKNSGVMFHAQAPESMGINQSFPVSVEAQFLGGSGEEERPTGSVCTPGTHIHIDGELLTQHCISSTSETYHGDEWVCFELVVLGDSIVYHIVNGDTVMQYTHPIIGGNGVPEGFSMPEGTPLSAGYIALQAESHPYEFRKVELLDLSK
ncbi:MAG: hypothetical protein CSA96_04755 [Bacteroidetes bacterium]|nr:MAG: hypothetical protein CSA96_04755 [Bacteroidota bacterium]